MTTLTSARLKHTIAVRERRRRYRLNTVALYVLAALIFNRRPMDPFAGHAPFWVQAAGNILVLILVLIIALLVAGRLAVLDERRASPADRPG